MSLLAGRYRFIEVIGSGQSSILLQAEVIGCCESQLICDFTLDYAMLVY